MSDSLRPHGLNLGLLHCRQILYHLSHQGRPLRNNHEPPTYSHPDFQNVWETLWMWCSKRFWDGRLPRWTQCNHKDPCKHELKGSESEKMWSGGWSDATAGCEDGRGPGAQGCGKPLIAERGKQVGPPLEPLEGTQLCWFLDFRNPDLHNYKIINLCGLKTQICGNRKLTQTWICFSTIYIRYTTKIWK